MLKIAIGFAIFASVAMFVILKGGDTLDMGGEKRGVEVEVHAPATAPVQAPQVAPAGAPAAKQ